MIARLHWKGEDGTACSILVEDRVFIGRACRGVAAERKILINDPRVSQDHAVVTLTGQQLSVCDSSRNGTLLNGARLTTGVERSLHDGDTLTIGNCTLRLAVEGETASFETLICTEKTTTINLRPVVTHLVGDVRGYSTASQHLSSTLVYDVMKGIFGDMSKIVHRHRGVVKDFAGDAIFAIWEHGEEADPGLAVSCCRAALDQLRSLPGILAGLPEECRELRHLLMGWGITTGTVTLSHYGVQKGSLAVVGDSTNLAFRLSGLANKTLNSPIVLCRHTAELVGGDLPLRELGEVDTKGREGREKVFGLDVEKG